MADRSISPVPATIKRQDSALADASNEDAAYLHSVLAQCGLPRNPTSARSFERSNGATSLRVEAGAWFDGRKWIEQPLPSGTRPRLVLIHACSEAIRTRSPVVDIDESARAFLRRLRIDTGGKILAGFRHQMTALAACRLTLGYRTGDRVVNVKCDPVEEFTAWIGNDDHGQRALWPGELRLSDRFLEELLEHAVPMDQSAVASLQNSALALDVYAWLTHRLHRIAKPAGVPISWTQLHQQFGQEYRTTKDFKRELQRVLSRVLSAYPGARVEPMRGGVRLMPSPPPVKPRAHLVTVPESARPAAPEAAATGVGGLEMTDALKVLLRRNAPGWDTHRLLALYKEWMADKPAPGKPMAACAAWAKSFTKGKPPA